MQFRTHFKLIKSLFYGPLVLLLLLLSFDSFAFELVIYSNNHQYCQESRKKLFDQAAVEKGRKINIAREGIIFPQREQGSFGIEDKLPMLVGNYINFVNGLRQQEEDLPDDQYNLSLRNEISNITKSDTKIRELYIKEVLMKKEMGEQANLKDLLGFKKPLKKFLAKNKKYRWKKLEKELSSNVDIYRQEIARANRVYEANEDFPISKGFTYEKDQVEYVLFSLLLRNRHMLKNLKKVIKEIKSEKKIGTPQNIVVLLGLFHTPYFIRNILEDKKFMKLLDGVEPIVQQCFFDKKTRNGKRI